MRFTNAYAGSSVCAPSRCSLMTGFHNGHNRIRDNLPQGIYLRPDDFTLAELMKQAGYSTGGVGKWGLGKPGTWGLPNQQGFDNWFGHYNQDQAHFYYPDFVWENDEVILLQELNIVDEVGVIVGNRGGENTFYTHDLFTEKAIDFIHTNKNHPFFLFISYTIPHYSDYPKDSPEHYIVPSDEPYTSEDWPQIAKNYAAMITRMDRDVGRLMDVLQDLHLEGNTIVIFTSDNGPYQGVSTPIEFFDSNGPLRGGKRDLYEGGIRIPFIVKWKNTVETDARCDKIIAFWDILATFADIIAYPGTHATDGISFLPELKGNHGDEHEYLYWDYGHVRPTYKQAVRFGNYKMLRTIGTTGEEIEIYDLERDPGESQNIRDEHPDLLGKIKQIMMDAYNDTDDYPLEYEH